MGVFFPNKKEDYNLSMMSENLSRIKETNLIITIYMYSFIKVTLLTCDGVSEVLVVGLPQQPDQSRHSVTVLDGDLVVVIFAVRDVL